MPEQQAMVPQRAQQAAASPAQGGPAQSSQAEGGETAVSEAAATPSPEPITAPTITLPVSLSPEKPKPPEGYSVRIKREGQQVRARVLSGEAPPAGQADHRSEVAGGLVDLARGGYVHSMWTLPGHRGKGLAQLVFDRLLRAGGRWLRVRLGNDPAIRCYAHHMDVRVPSRWHEDGRILMALRGEELPAVALEPQNWLPDNAVPRPRQEPVTILCRTEPEAVPATPETGEGELPGRQIEMEGKRVDLWLGEMSPANPPAPDPWDPLTCWLLEARPPLPGDPLQGVQAWWTLGTWRGRHCQRIAERLLVGRPQQSRADSSAFSAAWKSTLGEAPEPEQIAAARADLAQCRELEAEIDALQREMRARQQMLQEKRQEAARILPIAELRAAEGRIFIGGQPFVAALGQVKQTLASQEQPKQTQATPPSPEGAAAQQI